VLQRLWRDGSTGVVRVPCRCGDRHPSLSWAVIGTSVVWVPYVVALPDQLAAPYPPWAFPLPRVVGAVGVVTGMDARSREALESVPGSAMQRV
jgi:hypothetical protein